MLIYNTTKVRVGISISLMPLPCVKNLPSARLIFFLLSQIFFLGIACCFRSVLLSISEWRFKGHHQLAALLHMYYTTAVWFNVKKSFCPISRRQGASKNARGKKLIMPDMLRIRCRTGIHIGTKACLKSYILHTTLFDEYCLFL